MRFERHVPGNMTVVPWRRSFGEEVSREQQSFVTCLDDTCDLHGMGAHIVSEMLATSDLGRP